MKHFLVSGDPKYRAVTQTDDGKLIAFPHAGGGKIDSNNPVPIPGFDSLSDSAGITERSHLSDPLLESVVTKFSNQTLPI